MHVLSIDVEEYFHAEAARNVLAQAEWSALALRSPGRVDRLLELLAEHNCGATFFVLGWLAARDAGMVKRIAAAGHEVASHGYAHRMITAMSPAEFRHDVRRARQLLEDLSGQSVRGYRAPTFSITHRTAWALDVLAEEGHEYDSSVFPVRHDRYGVPKAPPGPHWALGPGGRRLLELPPLTLRLLGANWPVGGGGYLRLLPVGLCARVLRRRARGGRCGMIYLHPWELDPHQPRLPMRRFSLWRHRVNLHRTERKLKWLLERFAFASVRDCAHDLRRQAARVRFAYGPSGVAPL
jgi:polysaccharide deacetylase family protein (PEP-CTERM system associated)